MVKVGSPRINMPHGRRKRDESGRPLHEDFSDYYHTRSNIIKICCVCLSSTKPVVLPSKRKTHGSPGNGNFVYLKNPIFADPSKRYVLIPAGLQKVHYDCLDGITLPKNEFMVGTMTELNKTYKQDKLTGHFNQFRFHKNGAVKNERTNDESVL